RPALLPAVAARDRRVLERPRAPRDPARGALGRGLLPRDPPVQLLRRRRSDRESLLPAALPCPLVPRRPAGEGRLGPRDRRALGPVPLPALVPSASLPDRRRRTLRLRFPGRARPPALRDDAEPRPRRAGPLGERPLAQVPGGARGPVERARVDRGRRPGRDPPRQPQAPPRDPRRARSPRPERPRSLGWNRRREDPEARRRDRLLRRAELRPRPPPHVLDGRHLDPLPAHPPPPRRQGQDRFFDRDRGRGGRAGAEGADRDPPAPGIGTSEI